MIMPLSFPTHNDAISSPSRAPSVSSKMPPWIIPLMHSYRSDIAGVVRIRVVRGGRSFLVRRGSKGVSVANYSCQLSSKTVDHISDQFDYFDSHPIVAAVHQ